MLRFAVLGSAWSGNAIPTPWWIALKAVETIATSLSQALTPSTEDVSETIEGLTNDQSRIDISLKNSTRPVGATNE
jgi:hypothetical protein